MGSITWTYFLLGGNFTHLPGDISSLSPPTLLLRLEDTLKIISLGFYKLDKMTLAQMLFPGSQVKAGLQWTVGEGYGIQQMTNSREAAAFTSEQTVRCAQCAKWQKELAVWEKKWKINLQLVFLFWRKMEINLACNTKLSDLTWKL